MDYKKFVEDKPPAKRILPGQRNNPHPDANPNTQAGAGKAVHRRPHRNRKKQMAQALK